DSDVRNLSLLAELVLGALKPEDEDRFAESAQVAVKNLGVEPGPTSQANLAPEKFVAKEPWSGVEPAVVEIVASPATLDIKEPPPAPAKKVFAKPAVALDKAELDRFTEPQEMIEPEVLAPLSTHRPGVFLVLALVVVASLLAA